MVPDIVMSYNDIPEISVTQQFDAVHHWQKQHDFCDWAASHSTIKAAPTWGEQ